MQPLLTQLLGLPGIEVEDYHDFGDKIIPEVEARTEIAACTRLGKRAIICIRITGILPEICDISQRQVLLKVNRRQFKCHSCGKPLVKS
jgi:transposase